MPSFAQTLLGVIRVALLLLDPVPPSTCMSHERRRCRPFELVIATMTPSAQLSVPVPVEHEDFTDALIPSKSAVDIGWFEGDG